MAVSIVSRPGTPVQARTRQQWAVRSTGHGTLDRYRVEFVLPQSDGLPDIVITQVPGADGMTYFELSDVLDALLGHTLPNRYRYSTDRGAYKTIRSSIVERWSESPDGRAQEMTASTPVEIKAIKGGTGHRARPFDFNGYFKDRFLAFTGNGMKVTKDTALYLCFLFTDDMDTDGLAVEVGTRYDDGTATTRSVPVPVPSAFSGKMMLLTASYENLGLSDGERPGNMMTGYGVRLKVAGTGFDMQYFNVELTDRKVRKSFLFANSAGGWSILNCFGNYEEEGSFQMEKVEVNVPIDNGPSFAQYRNFTVKGTDDLKVSTGHLEKGSDEVRHCREFLLSRYRYEIAPGGAFTPIVLNSPKFVRDRSGIGLLALQFTYSYAFDNGLYDLI